MDERRTNHGGGGTGVGRKKKKKTADLEEEVSNRVPSTAMCGKKTEKGEPCRRLVVSLPCPIHNPKSDVHTQQPKTIVKIIPNFNRQHVHCNCPDHIQENNPFLSKKIFWSGTERALLPHLLQHFLNLDLPLYKKVMDGEKEDWSEHETTEETEFKVEEESKNGESDEEEEVEEMEDVGTFKLGSQECSQEVCVFAICTYKILTCSFSPFSKIEC